MKKIKYIIFITLIVSLYFYSATSASAANLTLTATQTKIRPEETFTVDIVLSGDEETLGTDVILKYDPQMLQALNTKETAIYTSYQPASSQRINAQKGTVYISGSASQNKPVIASGVLASVTFKAIKAGQSVISFDYQKDATNKTGIISTQGRNLLVTAPSDLTVVVASPNPLQTLWENIGLFFKKVFGQKK